ncbi:uncharacterized protein LOC121532651 [Coregonus clupeaformis]|uniref:uncharacterized protein LOC121532651 n=1 Tax=Coregonus clupeaformis TaxID=59861 RepID=UPI001E1C836A|nr:uncharacterized protein LOC121532651 [Coregonus clupeaformis]
MVERYDPEAAVEITLMILKRMDQNDLTKKLQRDNRASGYKATEEDCVRLIGSSSSAMWTEASGSKDTGIQQDKYELFTETPKLSDLDPERGLEMANSLNTQVAVNTQENTQRMDEELGRERDSPLFLEQHHMSSPDEFTPEIHDQDNRGEYRFQCPSAGLFQCSITGLVFRMEGEGGVLYRTVPWDRRLLAQRGKIPAGPLFKFTCLKGSVCQLHLPHCEIHSEGGCDFLSVAHVTDDDSTEFLHPHETTETHVILNINGFSNYGITKDKEAPVSPIRGLVLLFYQLPDDTNNSTLNVLLMPRNVDIDEEPVAVSEREQMPAGAHNANLPSTSSGMLTRSVEKRLRLERQREEPRALGIKRPSMLDVPAPLLTTLEELTGEQLKTFQSYLTSVQLPGFPPIPENQLENADRQDTVDQMVKRYDPEGAVRITLMNLRKMHQHDLAKKLQRDLRVTPPGGATAGTTKVHFLLLDTLQELGTSDLNTFQWYLIKGVEGFPSISKGQLGDADTLVTVDKMVQSYGDEGAVKFTLKILRKMGQNKLADELKEKVTKNV